jgi:class 3 adenylate cyclase
MGDGIMVVFQSALDAVASAVLMQQAPADPGTQYPQGRLAARVGIHSGEPIRVEGDYFGMAVNLAVMLCHTADPGQVLVSDLVHGLVRGRGAYAFRDAGERVLTDASAPMRVWEVVCDTADADTEPLARRAAEVPVRPDREPDTVVILFADIVDSMPHTERLGDAAFRSRSRDLDALLRRHVREHRGRTVDGKLVGDGVLAIFPSARSAIACAMQCGALGASVELELHLGIHAGDVIRDGNNIYGGAVNIASRIAMATKAGEILASETVRGLARTSAGVLFEDRGEYMLKGIDEPHRLYSIRTS